ncbi:MAG: carboxymuconolactone decarboxylase family protein [Deltaproteobacteria bacterium]|nr:carboxymuconolactone decarboxylase family protein [Deltaproteobacteria bacterium]
MKKTDNARPKLTTLFQIISITALLLFYMALTGCASMQKGSQEVTRLKESRMAPLPESQWNVEQTKLLTPLKRDGHVPNVFTTIARNQKLFERHGKFGFYVLFEQTLPARDREILILRIGWLCQSEYEFGQHTILGKMAKLTDEEILNITRGPNASGWNTFEAALINAVDELYYNAIISDSTWKVLASKYNEQQLLDLIFTVGQYNLVSWALNSLGVPLDKGIPGFPEGSK